MVPEFRQSPILLTNSRGANAKAVANHAIALLLALTQNLPGYFKKQAKRVWERDEVHEIEGKTAAILGFGSVGQEIAIRCKALDLNIIGRKTNISTGLEPLDKIYPPSALKEMLSDSDFVFCALPLTNETANLLGEKEFSAMKPSAFFINISRGSIVKEDELYLALKEGKIRGAALDVFTLEPLHEKTPLWLMENVIITPHIAWKSQKAIYRAMGILRKILKDFLREGIC